jgi:chromosome segregation ATPase
MSRKTKAELEAENAELGSSVAELESLVAELEREIRSLREMRDMVRESAEWDQYKLKITDEALEKMIQDSCERINVRDKTIEGYKRGPLEIIKKAKEKKKYLIERYNHWLTEGKRYDKAREYANDELKDKFGLKKGYGKTKLYEFCPKPEDQ